jgi:drug/metabolite transporter (DMT)-like permease
MAAFFYRFGYSQFMRRNIPSSRTRGLLSGFLVALFWGYSFLSIKVAVAVIPPMTLGLMRFVVATLILLPLKMILAPKDKLSRKDFLPLIGGGVFGITLYFLAENNGVKLTTASESSLVISCIPVITMLVERFVLKAKMSLMQYVGAGLSTVGVWLIVSESLSLKSGALGYVYMAGAALCWVVYSFLTRDVFQRHERVTIVFWQSLFGTCGFIPFAIFEKGQMGPISANIALNVAFLAVFCSAVGYLLYADCIVSLGLTASNAFVNLIPVVTVVASLVILGERLSAVQWVGAAVVVFGVSCASMFSYANKRKA